MEAVVFSYTFLRISKASPFMSQRSEPQFVGDLSRLSSYCIRTLPLPLSVEDFQLPSSSGDQDLKTSSLQLCLLRSLGK